MNFRVRAVYLTALFLFSTYLLASENNNSKNHIISASELIKNSQSLLIMGDRPRACETLISYLSKEGSKTKGFNDLSKALKKCSEFFLLEKAQQIYEVAIASFEKDKKQSLAKFKEALDLEQNNALIIKGLFFTLLSQNECLLAKNNQDLLKKINPYDEEFEYLKFLQLICSKNISEALSIFVKIDPSSLNQPFWQVNKLRLAPNGNNQINLEPPSVDVKYPELIYTHWVYEKNINSRIILAEKYKQLCHTPVNFETAYKFMDPWICSHTKEVEDFLVKKERNKIE